MNQIYNHSSESMSELEDGSVALTITSPPYWNAIDYNIHASDKTQHYRTRSYTEGFTNLDEYFHWLVGIFNEVQRVTKPGGYCAIIIGTVLLKGRLYPVPFELVAHLTQNNWDFHQDIIWHKCTAGVKRAGVTIQRPFPGYYYPNIMNEYILVFRKPGEKIYLGRSTAERESAEFPIDELFTKEVANNIWHIAPVPPNHIDHPAPFPEEIPYRLISLYSFPGELVLDPFTGSGQTLKVARHLERQFVGYEVIQKYVELATARLDEPLKIRPDQLVAIFNKIQLQSE